MLRHLRIGDASRMLEWMHNEDVIKDLHTDFLKKEIKDCEEFIRRSEENKSSVHFAVTNENDLYLGTVSLRIIEDRTAEFAIVMHPDAIGKGLSKQAMDNILEYGFNVLNLVMIFWCVSQNNIRAVRFYDSRPFKKIDIKGLSSIYQYVRQRYTDEEIDGYEWYAIERKNKCIH